MGPPPEPEPIIVTAAKRRVPYADFPGVAEVIGGDTLTLEGGLRGSEALVARLPSLTSTHLGPGRNKLFIRGIADSSFTGPTQATVGQYLGETRLTYNAPDPDLRLHDLERVEVLSGPQGTLYGAASLGGVIRLVPRPPELDAFRLEAAVGASHTQHGDPGVDASTVLNLPLVSERVGFRLAAYGMSEGGYIDDFLRLRENVNRTRVVGGRTSIRASAGMWLIDLGLAAQRIRGEDSQFANRDAPPLSRGSPVQQNFGNDFGLADVVLTREAGSMRFVSAAGIVRHRLNERFDVTRPGEPPAFLDQTNRVRLFSAESRLSRQAGTGTNWLIGKSFLHNRSDLARTLGSPGASLPTGRANNAVSELALFGEATMPISASISATAGGRVTYVRLSSALPDLPPGASASSALLERDRETIKVLPSAAIAARAHDDVLLFLRYQESFRPGGLALSGGNVRQFRGDDLASFEAGIRYGTPAIGRLDALLSLVYTRWRDIQADIVDLSRQPVTANIGNGRIYTVDARLGWRPARGLSLDAGAVYNDSLITDSNPTVIIVPRSSLPNVARVNARFGATYRSRISDRFDVKLSGNARYVGKSALGIGPLLGDEQGEWLDVSLTARASTGRHALTLSLTNLSDSVGNRFALGSPFNIGQQRHVTPLRPRTFRIGWEIRL